MSQLDFKVLVKQPGPPVARLDRLNGYAQDGRNGHTIKVIHDLFGSQTGVESGSLLRATRLIVQNGFNCLKITYLLIAD